MTSGHQPRGRDRHDRSRLRATAVVAVVAAVAASLVGVSWWSSATSDHEPRADDPLKVQQEAANAGQQVLGGTRRPGVPQVQRLRHDGIDFTVTVAPGLPGPNLVRVDTQRAGKPHSAHSKRPVRVGTVDDDRLVVARPRPGVDGLWAVVQLTERDDIVLVSHGPVHRVPFVVTTGFDGTADADFSGPDGPECLTAATGALLGGGEQPSACPADALSDADGDTLERLVGHLAGRGVEQLTVWRDDSARSVAAYDLVRRVARSSGVRLAPASAPASSTQGVRNALLVLSGWSSAASSLAAVSAQPLRQQPIRSDGTWLAPWLLTPQVVDSTSGAVLPLDFDIRDTAAQEYSQTLARYFPGQSPTASGYLAWRTARGDSPSAETLYAASRAAYMPALPGHEAHGSEVSWFPGGTVTPVGSLP